jgi:hypothetical protein
MRSPFRSLLVATIVVVASSSAARADELTGEWIHSDAQGEIKLSLKADGSFELATSTGKWTSEPGKLILVSSSGDETLVYTAKVEGDKLALSGGDLGDVPIVWTRHGEKPKSPEPRKADGEPAKPEEKPMGADLSRRPQAVPADAKKLAPKFSTKTRTVKAPSCEITLPESWTLTPGEKDGVAFLSVNPGLQATDVLRQQIVFWVRPLKLAEIESGFKDRVEKGAAGADALFQGSGLSMERKKLEIHDAPGGLLARLDYAGTLTNQFVQGQKASGLLAVVQRKMYDVAVTIVTLEGNEKDWTGDALAVLDSTKCFLKDRDAELEKKIAGTWLVPSKTGNTTETYQFMADGTYKWHYESSYTGTLKDPGGFQAGAWGTSSQNDEAGRYEIRGDLIFFVSNRGEQGLRVALGANEKGTATLTIGSKTFLK